VDDERRRRTRFRSLLIGGLLGSAAGIAAERMRVRRPAPRRETPAGLAAFEQAPCYQELLDQERDPARGDV